jgi:hypothetical protein
MKIRIILFLTFLITGILNSFSYANNQYPAEETGSFIKFTQGPGGHIFIKKSAITSIMARAGISMSQPDSVMGREIIRKGFDKPFVWITTLEIETDPVSNISASKIYKFKFETYDEALLFSESIMKFLL